MLFFFAFSPVGLSYRRLLVVEIFLAWHCNTYYALLEVYTLYKERNTCKCKAMNYFERKLNFEWRKIGYICIFLHLKANVSFKAVDKLQRLVSKRELCL
jgi:hypothetical protein